MFAKIINKDLLKFLVLGLVFGFEQRLYAPLLSEPQQKAVIFFHSEANKNGIGGTLRQVYRALDLKCDREMVTKPKLRATKKASLSENYKLLRVFADVLVAQLYIDALSSSARPATKGHRMRVSAFSPAPLTRARAKQPSVPPRVAWKEPSVAKNHNRSRPENSRVNAPGSSGAIRGWAKAWGRPVKAPEMVGGHSHLRDFKGKEPVMDSSLEGSMARLSSGSPTSSPEEDAEKLGFNPGKREPSSSSDQGISPEVLAIIRKVDGGGNRQAIDKVRVALEKGFQGVKGSKIANKGFGKPRDSWGEAEERLAAALSDSD